MLSQTAEYAVRATLFLARRGPDRPVPAEAIAQALGAPANYMSKTLHLLAKAGIVRGTRGPAGGFRLAHPPETLSVARIVATFDAPRQNPICMLGDRPCNSRDPCAAHARWSAMTGAMRAPLLETTLADLLVSEDDDRLRGAVAG